MQIDARRGVIHVRLGPTFAPPDALQLPEALASLGRCSELTIDFGATRDCDDAALVHLATALRSIPHGRISLRGLTHHQWRLLTYLGLRDDGAPAGVP